MRTPTVIAADARDLLDKASKFAVPANLLRLAELNAEFMESTAAVLSAAGLEPAPAPAEAPAAPQA